MIFLKSQPKTSDFYCFLGIFGNHNIFLLFTVAILQKSTTCKIFIFWQQGKPWKIHFRKIMEHSAWENSMPLKYLYIGYKKCGCEEYLPANLKSSKISFKNIMHIRDVQSTVPKIFTVLWIKKKKTQQNNPLLSQAKWRTEK